MRRHLCTHTLFAGRLPPREFREKVRRALEEGVGGRRFVLIPSAAPYGRTIPANAMSNYEAMLDDA